MKYLRYLILCSVLSSVALGAGACSRKSGCPMNEQAQPRVNKKGELRGGGKAKSGLFPKKMSKRMR